MALFLAGAAYANELDVVANPGDTAASSTFLEEGEVVQPVPEATLLDTSAYWSNTLLVTGKLRYDYAYAVLDILNQERRAEGLGALVMDKELLAAAMQRSAEIVVLWSHTRPDGSSCFTASGKMHSENIAKGYISPQSVMSGWMDSSGHRTNILRSSSKSVGIGVFEFAGTLYWVQCFGPGTAERVSQPSNTTKTMEVGLGNLYRFWGPTALDTMNSITKVGFNDGSCDTVVVATLDGYWDALSATALAGLNDCPVLLTSSSSLSSQTKEDIQRLGAKKVYIAGGKAAVSAKVETQIKSLGLTTERLAGDDAIETALKIYTEGKDSWGKTAIVATTASYHDALAASPYAYAQRAPVFLVTGSSITSATLSAIQKGGFNRILICGGTAAVSKAVENKIEAATGLAAKRLSGATAYETSVAIAEWSVANGMNEAGVAIATGTSYYDALTGASLCGTLNIPLVLIGHGNTAACDDYIAPRAANIILAAIYGGDAAVDDYEQLEILAALR